MLKANKSSLLSFIKWAKNPAFPPPPPGLDLNSLTGSCVEGVVGRWWDFEKVAQRKDMTLAGTLGPCFALFLFFVPGHHDVRRSTAQ